MVRSWDAQTMYFDLYWALQHWYQYCLCFCVEVYWGCLSFIALFCINFRLLLTCRRWTFWLNSFLRIPIKFLLILNKYLLVDSVLFDRLSVPYWMRLSSKLTNPSLPFWLLFVEPFNYFLWLMIMMKRTTMRRWLWISIFSDIWTFSCICCPFHPWRYIVIVVVSIVSRFRRVLCLWLWCLLSCIPTIWFNIMMISSPLRFILSTPLLNLYSSHSFWRYY